MNSSYLPSSFESILSSFAFCFTAPSFENFVALLCGWVLSHGPHTISRAIVAATAHGLAHKGHSAYYRLLSRARWSVDEVGHVLFDLLLPYLPDEIDAVVDDTLCHRTGPQIFGAGMHHDASRSTYGGRAGAHKFFAFGHNWVVLSIWVPLPWNRERGVALPVLFRLYRSKKRCPKALYHKRTELAAETLEILRGWLPEGRLLHLTGDSEYACRTLVRSLPDSIGFTGPMAMDAALYAMPRPRKDRGRRAMKGRKLPSPAQRCAKNKWKRVQATLYGREVNLLIQTFTCLWYTVAGTRTVRVVITRDPKRRHKDRAYFCTDPERSWDEILSRYARRWELEVTFKTAKQSLGLEEPRNGWWRRIAGRRGDRRKSGPKQRGNIGRKAVERTAPFIFLTYGIVTVWFFKYGDVDRQVRRQRRNRPWYGLKQEPCFDDMLAALRREFWASRISRHPTLRRHARKILALIDPLLGAA